MGPFGCWWIPRLPLAPPCGPCGGLWRGALRFRPEALSAAVAERFGSGAFLAGLRPCWRAAGPWGGGLRHVLANRRPNSSTRPKRGRRARTGGGPLDQALAPPAAPRRRPAPGTKTDHPGSTGAWQSRTFSSPRPPSPMASRLRRYVLVFKPGDLQPAASCGPILSARATAFRIRRRQPRCCLAAAHPYGQAPPGPAARMYAYCLWEPPRNAGTAGPRSLRHQAALHLARGPGGELLFSLRNCGPF